MKKNIFFLFLVIILTIPGILALFHPGFFITDDGSWMIVRFTAFFDALKHGQFPVRFLSRLNNEYGYPVADFLYPLFMYIAIPIKLIGLSFVTSIKVIFGVSLLFSGIFSYLWLKKKFDFVSSVIGSICYTLFPYHLWDLYKRGSVGEVLALAIVPFILWQIERGSIVLTSIGVALLITAHNVMALFFLPIIIVYSFLIKKFSYKETIIFTVLGLGISAFFWFPALFDKQYTIFDSISVSNISDYFLGLSDYILFGFITLLAFVHAVFYLKKSKIVFLFFFILGLGSLVFTFPITRIFWKILPATNLIQFPFRLLSITTLCVAYISANNLGKIKTNKLFIGGIYLLVIYLSSWNMLIPKYFENFPDSYYATNVDSTTVKNEYLPKWVRKQPTSIPQQKVQVTSGKAEISKLIVNPDRITFVANAVSQSIIQINTVYFPGWKVYVNTKLYGFSYDNPLGVIVISLPKGTSSVVVQFGETTARLIADAVSVISIIIALGIQLYLRRKNK